NMQKKIGLNPSRPDSGGFDLYKPDGWEAPSHKENLGFLEEVLSEPRLASERELRSAENHLSAIEANNYSNKIDDLCIKKFLQVTKLNPLRLQKYSKERVEQAIQQFDEAEILFVERTQMPDLIEQFNFKIDNTELRTAEKRKFAIRFLEDCKDLMIKKAAAYNADISTVKSADYYPRGLDDLYHMIHIKMLRAKSLIDLMRAGQSVNFENLQDTLMDLVNFSALTAEFNAGQMDGQNLELDLFCRPIKK
ncbi:MAG: hypothetical protein WBP82_08730, partial [Leuconostoc mesenteroides]